MESPAREINLTDVAQRIEKLVFEAAHIAERIEEAGNTLRGTHPEDSANGGVAPEPSGLVPLLALRLSVLENIHHRQRQGLNRLADGLREAPPPTPMGGLNTTAQQQNKYAVR